MLEIFTKSSLLTEVGFENYENIKVKFDGSDEVTTVTWYTTKMDRKDDNPQYESTEVRVIPLRPAYAISIHDIYSQEPGADF